MKDFIQPFTDLIKTLVQPESGTKFLVTISGMGAIVFLTMKGYVEGSDMTIIALAAMVISYYVADIIYKRNKGDK